jgi:hypothetical protein
VFSVLAYGNAAVYGRDLPAHRLFQRILLQQSVQSAKGDIPTAIPKKAPNGITIKILPLLWGKGSAFL